MSDSATAAAVVVVGRCDICQFKDGKWGEILLKCTKCGVCVHEDCYGLVPTENRNRSFECYACLSTPPNGTRPSSCVLCSVSFGTHAMHPIYDDHGKKGKPLILPADKKLGLPERTAWAHSLCAFFLGTTPRIAGCIYGCDELGNYDGMEDFPDEAYDSDEDGDDAEHNLSSTSEESDAPYATPSVRAKRSSAREKKAKKAAKIKKAESFESDSEEEEEKSLPLVRFVFAKKGKDGRDTPWTKRIKELRKELTCSICGQKDNKKTPPSLRIATQCSAGDETELPEFRTRHRELDHGCYVSFHVGCARWGKNERDAPPVYKRVYCCMASSLGHGEETERDPVFLCYCNAHAKDIKENKPGNLAREKKQPLSNKPAKFNMKSFKDTTKGKIKTNSQIRPHEPQDARLASSSSFLQRRNPNPAKLKLLKRSTAPRTKPAAPSSWIQRNNPPPNQINNAKPIQKMKHSRVALHPKQNAVKMHSKMDQKTEDDQAADARVHTMIRTNVEQRLKASNLSEHVPVLEHAKAYWKENVTVTGTLSEDLFEALWKSVVDSLKDTITPKPPAYTSLKDTITPKPPASNDSTEPSSPTERSYDPPMENDSDGSVEARGASPMNISPNGSVRDDDDDDDLDAESAETPEDDAHDVFQVNIWEDMMKPEYQGGLLTFGVWDEYKVISEDI